MRKRERERTSRHAAVIASSALWQIEREPPRPVDAGPGDDRAGGLRRWAWRRRAVGFSRRV